MRNPNTGETGLFNLAEDVSQRNDLAPAMPEKVAQMSEALAEYLKDVDAETLDAMREARLNEPLGDVDRANSEIAEINVRLKGETDESTKRDLLQKRDDRLLRLENHKRGLAQLEACRTKRSP